jgi:hypothetical protein
MERKNRDKQINEQSKLHNLLSFYFAWVVEECVAIETHRLVFVYVFCTCGQQNKKQENSTL